MSTVATCPDDEPRSERLTRARGEAESLRMAIANAMKAQSFEIEKACDDIRAALGYLAAAELIVSEEVTAAAKEGKEPS